MIKIDMRALIARMIAKVKDNMRTVVSPELYSFFGKILRFTMKWGSNLLFIIFVFPLVLPVVLVVRAIRPVFLIRFGQLVSSRIGHFAANTELYLCERDAGINVPVKTHLDIFYFAYQPICNQQLALMWKRVLFIWPSWLLSPIVRVNRLFPGAQEHEIGTNTKNDCDVRGLLEKYKVHIQFTEEEEQQGQSGLRKMGIPEGVEYVCLIVRDSAYLLGHLGWDHSYHNYRDSNIDDYVPAAEELAERGYYVIRMGAKVKAPMKSKHPKILHYATNGMRSDFMDIYLGAKCLFCISVSTGFDAIPVIFRRPVLFVNALPIGYLPWYLKDSLIIHKHYYSSKDDRELKLDEIFHTGNAFILKTNEYESNGIQLFDNTPEEIRDGVIEMVERLKDSWNGRPEDEELQKRFWEIISTYVPINFNGVNGEIKARHCALYLRNNKEWLL